MNNIKSHIRTILDFPKKGIAFKDITTLLNQPKGLTEVTQSILLKLEPFKNDYDIIAGLDARGFIFGAAFAQAETLPFVPIRKRGKLPHKTHRFDYELEYGSNTLEIHQDAFLHNKKVIIIDDLLATAGSLNAAIHLCEKAGAKVIACVCLIELSDLNGRAFLKKETSLTDNQILSVLKEFSRSDGFKTK